MTNRKMSTRSPDTKALNHTITRWNAIKRIFSLAIPMAMAYTFSFSVVIIGLLSGHLSNDPNHIAATTLIMVTMNTLVIIGISPLLSISIKASNHIGRLRTLIQQNKDEAVLQKQRQYIAEINKSGLLISLYTLPILLPLLFSKTLLVSLFGQDEAIAERVGFFLSLYAIAYPALAARVCFEQMMFSFAHVKPAMIIGFVSFVIGTFLAFALGFGFGFFPDFGLAGIAIGYIVDAYISAAGFGLYLAWHQSFKQFRFFHRLFVIDEINRQQAREILTIGLPITFTISTEMLVIFVISILAGLVGTTQLVAFNYVMQFVLFTFIAFAAFGNAACQEVSRELGARCYFNANRIAKYALVATTMLVFPLCFVVTIYPESLISIGSEDVDNTVITVLTLLMPIIALAVFFDAIRFNLLLVLRALHDHVISTTISTVALWLGVAFAASLVFKTNMGIYGVGTGYAIGFILATLGLSVRWWQKIKIGKMKILIS